MEATDDIHEAMFRKRGCCFLLPCLGSSPPAGPGGSMSWQRIRTAEKLKSEERWWISGWRKTREWSELIGGPKWKTFIRRFGRKNSGSRPDHVNFRYDSWSYSLNFDDGMKFTSPSLPLSTKSSFDFDINHNAPSLFQ